MMTTTLSINRLFEAKNYSDFKKLITINKFHNIDIENFLYDIFKYKTINSTLKITIRYIDMFLIENHYTKSQRYDLYADIYDEVMFMCPDSSYCRGNCYKEGYKQCSVCENKNIKFLCDILKYIYAK